VLLSQDEAITAEQLGGGLGHLHDASSRGDARGHEASVAGARGVGKVAEVEQEMVFAILTKTDWNISKSAKLLGLSRDMLRYRIEKFGLARPERTTAAALLAEDALERGG